MFITIHRNRKKQHTIGRIAPSTDLAESENVYEDICEQKGKEKNITPKRRAHERASKQTEVN